MICFELLPAVANHKSKIVHLKFFCFRIGQAGIFL